MLELKDQIEKIKKSKEQLIDKKNDLNNSLQELQVKRFSTPDEREPLQATFNESIASVRIVDTYINKHGKKIRVIRIKKKKKRKVQNPNEHF